jgi:O-antigen/teichoic acid export membrane protein
MSVLRQALRGSLLGFAPLMVAIAVFATPLVRLAFGEEWKPVAPLLSLFALAAVTWPWLVLTLVALNAAGRSVEVLRLELVKKPVAIGLVLVALPWGLHAIAASLIASAAFATVVHGHRCRQVLGYRWKEQASDLLPALAAAAAGGGAAKAMLALSGTSPWALGGAALAFVAGWVAASLIVARPAISDFVALARAWRSGRTG